MTIQRIAIAAILVMALVLGCNREGKGPDKARLTELESQVSVLEERIHKLEEMKPELSKTMNQLQLHHYKLYFAIKNVNRGLMKYVLHEIEEDIEFVVENHANHDNVNLAELAENTLLPAIRDLEAITAEGAVEEIDKGFENLTVSCNKCHAASGHPFIRIISPKGESYLNQDFTN